MIPQATHIEALAHAPATGIQETQITVVAATIDGLLLATLNTELSAALAAARPPSEATTCPAASAGSIADAEGEIILNDKAAIPTLPKYFKIRFLFDCFLDILTLTII